MTSSLKISQFCLKCLDYEGTYYLSIRDDFTVAHNETYPDEETMLITGEDLHKLKEYYIFTQGNYEAAVLCHFPHLAKEE